MGKGVSYVTEKLEVLSPEASHLITCLVTAADSIKMFPDIFQTDLLSTNAENAHFLVLY